MKTKPKSMGSKIIEDMPRGLDAVIPKHETIKPLVQPTFDYSKPPFVVQPNVTINHYGDTPSYFAIILAMGGAVFAGMVFMAVVAGVWK